ncbi:MAG TPA: UDP-3-O-(3-hydroxymyristoyl)glucosamine N-acyltransferase [Bacteroidales bacterium]|nr:UDP-3-O-(3-hydroxymyristoyl)glucosamine N-acyltransferase [Bacteroidales bacterium]HPS18288.1 UDP-3-O-(3-hydroxymyristoyl)glucosamine N-acyltransferase [Bacteroidales bacterium]
MKFEKVLKLKDVAGLIKAKYSGDADFPVCGINEIHRVEPGDITFVDHPKYYDKALHSKASIVIINKDVPCPKGKALIFSDDPFRDYVALVKKFRPFIPSSKSISDNAVIGEGTIIQPNAFIGNDVIIGKNCIIHANATIYDHCIIGDNVIIHSNSVIGADAYYFKRRPEGYDKLASCGKVIIEDNVEIGALCAVDIGVSGDTVVGKGTKIDNHVQVGHDTIIGKNCLIGSHTAIAGVSEIQDDVIIWARCSINKDLVIGKGAILLALSAVDKSIEGGKTYYGAPAEESRKKWKEIAMMRQLPSLIERLKALEDLDI